MMGMDLNDITKVLQISCEVQRYGTWAHKEAFEGKIIVDQDDVFWGCATQSPDTRDEFLFGTFARNREDHLGVAFYRMNNEWKYRTEMYIVSDFDKPNSCYWGEPCKDYSYFVPDGEAKIILTEQSFFTEEVEKIMEQFKLLDATDKNIKEILDSIEYCKQVIREAVIRSAAKKAPQK